MAFLLMVIAYVLGSIPFALVVGKLFYGADIRYHGSGNLGATNSVRVLGKRAGVLVLIGDVSKGILAASLPLIFNIDIDPLYVGFGAIIGHCFPLFAYFRGGKAVATTAGVLLVANPILFVIGFATFFCIIMITKYVAIGSILIAPSLAIYSIFAGHVGYSFLFLSFIPLMLFVHRKNISNLKKGIEPKINDKNLKKDRIQKVSR